MKIIEREEGGGGGGCEIDFEIEMFGRSKRGGNLSERKPEVPTAKRAKAAEIGMQNEINHAYVRRSCEPREFVSSRGSLRIFAFLSISEREKSAFPTGGWTPFRPNCPRGLRISREIEEIVASL